MACGRGWAPGFARDPSEVNMGFLDWITDPYGLDELEYDEETDTIVDTDSGPTWWEAFSQGTVETLGGWSAGSEQTGTASEAADQAEVWTTSAAGARGWTSAELSAALAYINAAENANDSALGFWRDLMNTWPANSAIAGWDELGDTFESAAEASGATYERAVAILKEFLPDPNEWERILRFAAIGATTGLVLGLTTKLNPTVGTLGGALVAGMYAKTTPEGTEVLGFLE